MSRTSDAVITDMNDRLGGKKIVTWTIHAYDDTYDNRLEIFRGGFDDAHRIWDMLKGKSACPLTLYCEDILMESVE